MRAKEIPSATLQDIHTKIGMSYEKIGQIYGLSRYLVQTALTQYYNEQEMIPWHNVI